MKNIRRILCFLLGMTLLLGQAVTASASGVAPSAAAQEPEYRIRRVSEYSNGEEEAGLYRDYRYDADGRLAEITQYLYGDLINLQYVYEYNPDGTLSAEWFYLDDSNTGINPSGLTRYRYNEAGEKIAEIYYAAAMEEDDMIEYRHDYTYDNGLLVRDDMGYALEGYFKVYDYADGVLQSVSTYEENRNSGESPVLSENTIYLYDSDGRLSQTRTTDDSGEESEYVDYIYDENGNLSEELRYNHFFMSEEMYGSYFTLSCRTVYEYEPVPAEGGQPADTAASEAGGNELYVPLIRSFIEADVGGNGLLCDLDGDADDELLIFYVRDIPGGAGYALPMALCGVYDIRDGRTEPVFEEIEICSMMGGNLGEAGIARLDGEPYLYTSFRSGHNIGMQSTEETILYDCREGRAAASYLYRYTLEIIGSTEQISGESYELNGSPCSEAEYTQAFAQIEFVDGIDSFYRGQPLDRVLETIVGP